MALHLRRLHRALSQSYFLLEHSFHGRTAKLISSTSAPRFLPTPAATTQFMRRPFTSTPTLFRRAFNPETDEIRPDAVLFEGCDYNHWVITVDVHKDSNITFDQMIETYVNIAAQVFGSVEEAKKRIYALSTCQGFKVECSEETSEKFRSIPAVSFVLPDSYIDPAIKEYEGDKYVNGEIFPRPPTVHYGPPSQQNYGQPPPQQNYGQPPPLQQSYRQPPPLLQNYRHPPPQQNYGQPPPPPPPQQYYGPPPPQQYYGQPPPPPPPQQYYGPPPPQQYYGQPPPPPQQYYGQPPPPPQQNYGQPPPPLQQYYRQPPPPPQLNYGQPPPPQHYYGQPPPPQHCYGQPPPQHYYGQPPLPQQNYGLSPPPHKNYALPPPSQKNYGQPPPPQQNYGLPPLQNYGQSPLQQNYGQPPPQQNYGPLPQQNFWQSQQHNPGPPPCQNYASPQQHQSYRPPLPPQQNNMPNTRGDYGKSPNFPPHPKNNPAGPGKRSNTSGHNERILVPSYQGRYNQAEPKTRSAVGQGNFQSHPQPGERGFLKKIITEFSVDGVFEQAEPKTHSAVGRGNFQSHPQPRERGILEEAKCEFSVDRAFEQAEPETRAAVGQGNFQSHPQPKTHSAVGRGNIHIPNHDKEDICKKLVTEFSVDGVSEQAEPENRSAVGQAKPEKRGFLEVANYEYSALDGVLEQVVPSKTRSAVEQGNSHVLNPDEEYFFKKVTERFSLGVSEQAEPETHSAVGQAEPETRSAVGQAKPEKRGFLEVANYEYSALDGVLEQVVPSQTRSAVGQGNSHVLNPDEEYFFKKVTERFSLGVSEQAEPETRSAVGQAEPETRSAVGQAKPEKRGFLEVANYEYSALDGVLEQVVPSKTRSAVGQGNSHVLNPDEEYFFKKVMERFSLGVSEQAEPETRSAVGQAEPETRSAVGQAKPENRGFLEVANYEYSALDGVLEQVVPSKSRSAVGQGNSHVLNPEEEYFFKKVTERFSLGVSEQAEPETHSAVGQAEPETRSAVGQAKPEKRGFLEVANYEYSALDGVLEQVVPSKNRSAVGQGNSHILNPDEEYFFKKMTEKFSLGVFEQADSDTHSAVGQGNLPCYSQPGQKGFLEEANY
ncbi:altered inheritance of mitochondria protein 3-like [Salvia miltiorrhiza]|uniref:altered inheritance of mitochondria protein 3-like n=1 Tax=Salvia miltiorrhiza TaxID=226208 RepID=UPI0025AD7D86|nr:altered inheritance of mitochondria protein 3-like [Salvia miltiorrhiza]